MPRQEGEREKEIFRCVLSEMDGWIQQISGENAVPSELCHLNMVYKEGPWTLGCISGVVLQKATPRTEGKGLARRGAGVTVPAAAAVIASSLILNMKTLSWEAHGLAERGKEEEEGPR